MTRILGIESSCDETAAAVVEDGTRILSSVVASQLDTHGKYGGVVPELASREHLRAIVPVVREALAQAGARPGRDSRAVAVTSGPGLVGSLLVGVTYAKALSFARGLPLIGVNHIEGHIHAVISQARAERPPGGRSRRSRWWSAAATRTCSKCARRLRTTACSARLATTLPAKRSTRWASCSDSAIRADR